MRSLSSYSLGLASITLIAACGEGSGSLLDSTPMGGSSSVSSTGGAGATPGSNAGGQDASAGASTGGSTGASSNPAGGSTSTFSTDGCTAVPINPNATQQAKNLLCYLYSVNGKNVLSGQQETSWNYGSSPGPSVDVEWIKTQTGKYPAVMGGDLLYPGDTAKNAPGTIDRANNWWKAGGITMLRYHMGAPPLEDTYDNAKNTVANLDNVIKDGTTENTSFNSKLNYAAAQLTLLQNAGVAVLFAPLHEVQANGWFWWAKGTGPQFVAIWKYLYNYLTTTKGLNNLIWLLPFSGNPNSAYYPGKDFVDIAGPDTYDMTTQPFSAMYSTTRNVVGSTIPIPLHETGKIPNPDNMFPTAAPWVLFSVWCGYENDTTKNSVAEIKAAYDSPYTITRDEVPNLK